MTKEKISFTFKHCDKDSLLKDKKFDLEKYTEELNKVFETKVKFDRIDVEFILEGGSSTEQFICNIKVFGGPESISITEKGNDHYSQITESTIKKTIEQIRKIKDKFTDHH